MRDEDSGAEREVIEAGDGIFEGLTTTETGQGGVGRVGHAHDSIAKRGWLAKSIRTL